MGGGTHACLLCLDHLILDIPHYPIDPLRPIVCVGYGVGCHYDCYMEEYGSSCPNATWLRRSCLASILPLIHIPGNKDLLKTVNFNSTIHGRLNLMNKK